ncbi:MAG: reverse transcriptase family protein, partial [Candidatus Bipolaricaulota bacterium]
MKQRESDVCNEEPALDDQLAISNINRMAREFEYKHDYPYLCPISLNGYSCYAMLDSGNLVVNAISESFAKILYKTQDISDFIANNKDCARIGTAKQGEKLNVLGMAKKPLNLRFGGTACTFKTRPIIIRGLTMCINICGPFLAKNHIDQIHSKRAIRVKRKLVQLFQRNEMPTLNGIEEAPELTEARAYLAREIVIPASSQSRVELRIPEVEAKLLPSGLGVLAGAIEFMQSQDAHPALNALVETNEHGITHSTVLNTRDTPLRLSEGTFFGRYSSAVSHENKRSHPWRISVMLPKGENDEDDELVYKSVQTPVDETREKETKITKLRRRAIRSEMKAEEEQENRRWLREEFKLDEAPWLKDDERQIEQAEDLLLDFNDIFSRDDEYGETDLVEHAIDTTDTKPYRCKPRTFNPIQKANMKEQLDKWKRQGVIQDSNSPWAFNLLPVPKKNGKTRWVCDFRRLNEQSVKSCYPLPNIKDCLNKLSRSKCFSGIDGTGAFHCILIRKVDRHKVAFTTPFGLFEYRAMPFGLCNAPSTYSRLVQMVLDGVAPDHVTPYLDDICCHTESLEEHFQVLREVFKAHRKAGMMIQPAKCQLFQKE